VVVDSGDADVTPEVVDAIAAESSVEAVTAGRRSMLLRDGSAIPAFCFEPVRGSAYPTIVGGRAPLGDSEVALGAQTLERLDAGVGDRVAFRGPNGARVDLLVVGRTLIPVMNLGQDLSIAEGALVDGPLLERLGGASVSLALVDVRPGVTPTELRTALQGRGVEAVDSMLVDGAQHTADLRGYDQVRDTPLLLAALLAVLGVGVLVHTILSTTRRRRREHAVLQCIGFDRRDLRLSIRWSALTVVGACVLIAVPLGIGVGRLLWSSFARGIGVPDDPITPWFQVAVVVALATAGAVGIAAIAGRRASEARPAQVLRTE
jgi:putative ABC transport system permease protein